MGEVPEQTVLTNCVENCTQAVWEEEVKVFGIRQVGFDAGYLSQDFYFLYEKRFFCLYHLQSQCYTKHPIVCLNPQSGENKTDCTEQGNFSPK